jgi:integrase/recombinase XerC
MINHICVKSKSMNQSDFHAWLRSYQRVSPLTIASYERVLTFFFDFLKGYRSAPVTQNMLLELTLTDVRAFLAYRAQKNIKSQSQSVALSAIRTFYRFLVYKGHTVNASLHLVKRPRAVRVLPRPLSLTHIDQLMTLRPQTQDWVEWRNYSLFVLLYATGLRIQEALNLTQGQWSKQPLHVMGKGQKERSVPVLPEAYECVATYQSFCPYTNNSVHDPLFFGEKGKQLNAAIFQKYIRHHRHILNLPQRTTPHSLRHSFASHLLENGAPLRDIQELLGHSCLKSTQHYTKTTHSHLHALYQATHPSFGSEK